MSAYQQLYWSSPDGLKLHARDYPCVVGPGDQVRPPILCLPGLTRNARDYDALAARLAGQWRVIAINLRGRGGSEAAKDPKTYVPATYVADVQALLADQGIERFIAIGTSLGGIVTMLLAAEGAAIAAALINDIGPDIEAAGLARIRGYVGKASSFPTWMHAARAVAEGNADIYPDWRIADWLAMAKRLYRLTSAGRIVLDYDLKIAEPLRTPGTETGPDMWAALAALRDVPTLVVRGARSDLLSAAHRRADARRARSRRAGDGGAGRPCADAERAGAAGSDRPPPRPRARSGGLNGTMPTPVRILHLHSSFSLGGKEARAVRLMNAFGDAARHVVVSGVPDALGARDAIAKGIRYEIAQGPAVADRPAIGGALRGDRAVHAWVRPGADL